MDVGDVCWLGVWMCCLPKDGMSRHCGAIYDIQSRLLTVPEDRPLARPPPLFCMLGGPSMLCMLGYAEYADPAWATRYGLGRWVWVWLATWNLQLASNMLHAVFFARDIGGLKHGASRV